MIRPLRGYVLVELMEEDNSSPSGKLIIPDSAKEKPMKGKVAEVGVFPSPWAEGSYTVDKLGVTKSEVARDDIVYFKRWGGDQVKLEGKDYQFVAFADLLGVEE